MGFKMNNRVGRKQLKQMVEAAQQADDKRQNQTNDHGHVSSRNQHPLEVAVVQTPSALGAKHWLDYATAFLVLLAAATGIAAAGFSAWQAWIARDNEHRQLRAYLHPVIDEDEGDKVDLEKNPMEWTFSIKNFGQTPACHVRSSGQLFAGAPAFGLMPKPEHINQWGVEPKYCIAPQEKHRITFQLSRFSHSTVALSQQDKDQIRWGFLKLLYAHGTILYDDIWGAAHVTNFRTAFGGGDSMRSGKMDWALEGNSEE